MDHGCVPWMHGMWPQKVAVQRGRDRALQVCDISADALQLRLFLVFSECRNVSTSGALCDDSEREQRD